MGSLYTLEILNLRYDTTSSGESYAVPRVRHPNEAQTMAAPVTWRRFSANHGGKKRKYRREKPRRRTFDETHIIAVTFFRTNSNSNFA